MGKIYYSQVDSRWANHPYSSKNHPNATIKSGGCGATCAAMIVSSFKDIIYPDKMGDIFLTKGLRGLEGTNAEAFEFIGKEYGIKNELKWELDDAMACLKAGGMVVASCSAGLFTTGGHYIVLAGLKDDNTIIVYDPYLYTNKFNSYGRQGKVTVEGNNVYISYANFKEYGAYSNLYCYYPENILENKQIQTNKTMVVNTKSLDLNIRSTPGGEIVGNISKGKQVTVYEEQNGWSRIGDNKWVSSAYLVDAKNPNSNNYEYVLGKYVTNVKTALNVRTSPETGTVIKAYKNRTRFDTYEIRNNWARTPSGWVCLDFCNLVYKY